MVFIIVFRPGPVASPGFKFWLGWPGQFFFFFKSKRYRFSKKKLTDCNRVLPGQPAGSTGSQRVFPYPIFSSTRPGSSPCQAGFQNYDFHAAFIFLLLIKNF